jgi:hypothetical protein
MNPQTTPLPGTNKRSFKGLKIFLIVVAVIVLFFVGVFLITNQATKGAVTVSDKLIADLQNNDESAAYSLTSTAFRQTTSDSDLKQLFDRISPTLQGKAKVTAKAFNKTAGHPTQAVIVYAIDTADGTKYVRVSLQDNSPWQVIGFRSSASRLDTSSTE